MMQYDLSEKTFISRNFFPKSSYLASLYLCLLKLISRKFSYSFQIRNKIIPLMKKMTVTLKERNHENWKRPKMFSRILTIRMDLPGQDHHVDLDQDLGKDCENYGNFFHTFFYKKLISRKKNWIFYFFQICIQVKITVKVWIRFTCKIKEWF